MSTTRCSGQTKASNHEGNGKSLERKTRREKCRKHYQLRPAGNGTRACALTQSCSDGRTLNLVDLPMPRTRGAGDPAADPGAPPLTQGGNPRPKRPDPRSARPAQRPAAATRPILAAAPPWEGKERNELLLGPARRLQRETGG
jgi:hypothetical protein